MSVTVAVNVLKSQNGIAALQSLAAISVADRPESSLNFAIAKQEHLRNMRD